MKQILYKSFLMLCFLLSVSIANSQEATNKAAWYEPQVISTFNADGAPVDKTTLIYDTAANITTEIREIFVNNTWTYLYRRNTTYDKAGNKLTFLMEFSMEGVLTKGSLNTYTYDKDGNILTDMTQRWLNEEWVNNQRTVWTYDEQGNNLVKQQAMWQDENWVNTSGVTLTYDASGRKLTETTDFKGTGQSRTTVTYDDKGNKLTEIKESWNSDKNAWVHHSRTTSTYNELNKELSNLFENWTSEAWTPSQRSTNTYDAIGNQLIQLREKWIANSNLWESERKYTWTYVEGSNKIQSYLSEIYSNKVFNHYERATYTYNENEDLLTKLSEKWRNSAWVADNRNTYTYDANRNILTNLLERWQTDKWTINDSYTWAYDENGNNASFEKVGTGTPYFYYNNMQSRYNITTGMFAKATTTYVDVNAEVLIPVRSISLNKNELELEVGDKIQLQATISPENASNKKISWSASNGHATINNTGMLTAISGGSTVITVTTLDGGFTDICQVSVKIVAVEKVELNIKNLEITKGEMYSFSTIISPIEATNQNIRYQSSKENIAMISGKGLLTAISAGEVLITVTSDDGGLKDSCHVKVLEPVTSISLNKVSVDMRIGDTCRLIANISPSNASNKAILWTSSDSSILSVKEGLVTAIADGNARITATSSDANVSASCSFNIKTVSIDDLDSKKIHIYTSNNYILINSNVRILKVYSYDLNGRLIYEGNNANPIYTQAWIDGMYIIKVAAENNIFETKKILVK